MLNRKTDQADNYHLAEILYTTYILTVDTAGLEGISVQSWDDLDGDERDCWVVVAQAARDHLLGKASARR